MTGTLPVPAPPKRRVLTGIAPVAWEHPADRAALQTLRAIPGLDELVRRVMSFLGERSQQTPYASMSANDHD
jgi:hypothetical protein